MPLCNINPQTTELSAILGLTEFYAQAAQGGDSSLGATPGGKQEQEEEEDAQRVGSADEPRKYLSDNLGLSPLIQMRSHPPHNPLSGWFNRVHWQHTRENYYPSIRYLATTT